MPKTIALTSKGYKEVDENEVDLEIESADDFFGPHTVSVPLRSAVSGSRAFYGARFLNQAVPLKNPEAPLVRSLDSNTGKSWEEAMGKQMGAVRARFPGVVTEVSPDYIKYKSDDGEEFTEDLYHNFALNRKTRYHNTPLVKAGDRIDKDTLLARSNFTDDTGATAIGANARIALVPYLGYSYEDAIVISEDFANKLTSDHMLSHDIEFKRGVKGGKNHYVSLFHDKFNKEQLENIDDDGIVKEGITLNPGDPVILATAPRVISSSSAQLGNLSKYMKNSRTDKAQVWEGSTPGTVTAVQKNKDGSVRVNIHTTSPAGVGDKIVLRSGQKGIISKILGRNEMPTDEEGQPFDVLLNPMGIPSRQNNSLIYELLLGKAAAKKGEPYVLPSFNKPGESWYDFVQNELDRLGLRDTETIYDPVLDRKLENPVTTGIGHVYKLHHMVESKISGRGQGAYTQDQQPLKGGDEAAQSKRISGLETAALLSSGAYGVLKDSHTLRGQRNDEYWRMLRQGYTPNKPGSPFVWDKMQALLVGSGYHANKLGGGVMRLGPMTDKRLQEMNPVEVKSGEIINMKTNKPVEGGLFDDKLTGHNRWGFIPLDFPIINPAFQDPVQKMLGLTKKEFSAVMRGEQQLEDGSTGPEGIAEALKNISLEDLEEQAKKALASKKKTHRGHAIKLLNYVEGFKRNNIEPSDLILTRIPVVPPKFRPFTFMGDTFIPGDVNELYRELILIRDNQRELEAVLGEGAKDGKEHVYNAVKALYGHGEPVGQKTRQKGVSGFLQQLLGTNPKTGFVQSKLLAKPVDLSSRSTIIVDPNLGIDEIGIPEENAWKMFGSLAQRHLVRSGMQPAEAVKAIKERNKHARNALEWATKNYPVMYSRAPAWHRFNSIGGWAKIIEGDAIAVNPLITAGHNADFDGDTVNVHVPILPEAIEDVKNKIMPSKMLVSPKDFETVVPKAAQEFILGLYNAQNRPAKNQHVFKTRDEALQAIRTGRVSLQDEVVIEDELMEHAQNALIRAVVKKELAKQASEPYLTGTEDRVEILMKEPLDRLRFPDGEYKGRRWAYHLELEGHEMITLSGIRNTKENASPGTYLIEDGKVFEKFENLNGKKRITFYGTILNDPEKILQDIIGRVPQFEPVEILYSTIHTKTIDGVDYPSVTRTGKDEDTVEGIMCLLTTEEIEKIDTYENKYNRESMEVARINATGTWRPELVTSYVYVIK